MRNIGESSIKLPIKTLIDQFFSFISHLLPFHSSCFLTFLASFLALISHSSFPVILIGPSSVLSFLSKAAKLPPPNLGSYARFACLVAFRCLAIISAISASEIADLSEYTYVYFQATS